MLQIRPVQYDIPSPPSQLKHRRRNLLEIIMTWLVMTIGSSHICQICRRVDLSNRVSGWLQIDHPIYKDKNGCSCVCFECEKANPEIFEIPQIFYPNLKSTAAGNKTGQQKGA
jgi:hypothetical protein